MSNERKFCHTFWEPIEGRWIIKPTPEILANVDIYTDSEKLEKLTQEIEESLNKRASKNLNDSYIYLGFKEKHFFWDKHYFINLKDIEMLINKNNTYNKFINRAKINLQAVAQNKEISQQDEGGNKLQYFSGITFIIVTILVYVSNPILAFLRFLNPEKNSDGTKNLIRKRIEISALSMFLVVAFISVFIALAAIFIFYRKDREAKQKQFYLLMENSLKRAPSIEAEVKIKNEAIARLLKFLNLKLSLSEKNGIKLKFEISDVIKLILDRKNNLQYYENLKLNMKELENDFDSKDINKFTLVIVNFLFVDILKDHVAKIQKASLDKIVISESFSDLLIKLKQIKELSSDLPSIISDIFSKLIDMLNDMSKIKIIYKIVDLLTNINISVKQNEFDVDNNLSYLISSQLDTMFSTEPYRFISIRDSLEELNKMQYELLLDHISDLLLSEESYRLNLRDKLTLVLADISNKYKLLQIIKADEPQKPNFNKGHPNISRNYEFFKNRIPPAQKSMQAVTNITTSAIQVQPDVEAISRNDHLLIPIVDNNYKSNAKEKSRVFST